MREQCLWDAKASVAGVGARRRDPGDQVIGRAPFRRDVQEAVQLAIATDEERPEPGVSCGADIETRKAIAMLENEGQAP